MSKNDIDVEQLAEEQRLKTIFEETVKEELSGGAKSPGLIDYLCDGSGSEIRAKAISTAKDIERRRPATESSWENSYSDGESYASVSTVPPVKSQGEEALVIVIVLMVTGVILSLAGTIFVVSVVMKSMNSELDGLFFINQVFILPSVCTWIIEIAAVIIWVIRRNPITIL